MTVTQFNTALYSLALDTNVHLRVIGALLLDQRQISDEEKIALWDGLYKKSSELLQAEIKSKIIDGFNPDDLLKGF